MCSSDLACPYHTKVELNAAGLRVNASCRQGETHSESRVSWPPTVKTWLGLRFSGEAEVPPWAEGCTAPLGRPRVRSPESGMVVMLIPGMSADEQQLPLEVVGGEAPFTWFVDGKWLGVGNGERLWWTPTFGKHQLMVMDEGGGSSSVEVEVRAQR